MKYLKKFNESSITDDNIYNILHLLLPLIDHFDLTEYKVPSYVNHLIYMGNQLGSRYTQFELEIKKNTWIFEQYCYSIDIKINISKQYGTDIMDIDNKEFAEYLEEMIEPCKEILGAREVLIGYFNNDLSILFFPEKINYKRYKDVEIYGKNAIVKMPNGYLHSNMVTHPNCFDYYRNDDRINGLYATMYYYDGYRYNEDLSIIGSGKYDAIFSLEWHKVYKKLKLTSRAVSNFKITTPEFMVHLKNTINW